MKFLRYYALHVHDLRLSADLGSDFNQCSDLEVNQI